MSFSRVAAVVVLAFGPVAALAQSGELALPAEFPPASYSSNQYIDSAGCAFLRAGLSGTVSWVPRVNRDRSQLCGFQPSLVSTEARIAANAAAIAGAPVIEIAAPDAMTTAATAMTDVGMPIETVASLTTPLRAPALQPVSPRVIARPAVAVPPPRPEVAASIPRMTMAEICADMDATGRRYMNAVTGIAVRCGPQVEPVSPRLAAAPSAVTAVSSQSMVNLGGQVMSVAQLCQISDATGNRYLNAATGIAVRCGPQIESPSGQTAPLGQTMLASSTIVPPAAPVLAPVLPPVIAAAPVAQAPVRMAPAAPVAPPAGYVAVWDDGRLNPNRGLPAVQAAASVSAMNVPQAAVSAHRFVQVGTFADPANANRTAAVLHGLGLPVGFATISRNGRQMRIVAAGPFTDAAALQSALQAARAAGFADAFTRS